MWFAMMGCSVVAGSKADVVLLEDWIVATKGLCRGDLSSSLPLISRDSSVR